MREIDSDKSMQHAYSKTEERIAKMRQGEKLPCPRCSDGMFSAIGDPKTTNTFGCDKFQVKMTLTVPLSCK